MSIPGSKNIKITIDVKVEATNSSKRKKSIKFIEPDVGRSDDSSSGCGNSFKLITCAFFFILSII